jgi:hypothetical protein
MADERELIEQEVDGVEEGDSNESAQPTADETAERQPTQDKADRKVNLNELEEFRKYQSETDRRMAEMERRYQQQLFQQQQELRNRQMSEMDDYQRLEFELNETRQREAMAYQRLQEVEVQTAKQRALSEVSQTMGVPTDILMEAQDINEAWRMAAQYQRQSEQRRAEQAAAAAAQKAAARQDKQQRNAVDTGGGRPLPSNDWERQYQTFQQKRDPWSMITHALSNQQE